MRKNHPAVAFFQSLLLVCQMALPGGGQEVEGGDAARQALEVLQAICRGAETSVRVVIRGQFSTHVESTCFGLRPGLA